MVFTISRCIAGEECSSAVLGRPPFQHNTDNSSSSRSNIDDHQLLNITCNNSSSYSNSSITVACLSYNSSSSSSQICFLRQTNNITTSNSSISSNSLSKQEISTGRLG